MRSTRRGLKGWLQGLPILPEMYWQLIGRRMLQTRPRIQRFGRALEEWVVQAQAARLAAPDTPKKLLLFTNVPIWMQHSSLLAAAYAGMGHQVTLAYLPHEDWFTEQSDYQLNARQVQVQAALQAADGLFETVSWFKASDSVQLPVGLVPSIQAVCDRDYQYTHQVEEVLRESAFYAWRQRCNFAAAKAAYAWIEVNTPDVVLVPNGLILEFGAVYEVARYFEIPTVTYEFGEQQDRIWLTKNQPVMLQDTDALWAAVKDRALTAEQDARIKELYASRMEAGLWQNFARQWQDAPTEGSEVVRSKLGLDERPLVLMAANVIGDSLTLGRQVFSETMTEWIERTLDYFTGRPEVQFVLRIHPGERYTDGPSVEDIIRRMMLQVPDHFRIISASDPVNTYDLISAADLGIVYTTTVGMEMAMFGLPAVVVGKTHYRKRGFTHDPESWEQYFRLLDQAHYDLKAVALSPQQVALAWRYAYNFFFEYPRPFPWHLRRMEEDTESWPVQTVLADPALGGFKSTFDLLIGDGLPWEELVGTEAAETLSTRR